MDTNVLKTFVAVCEYSGFSAAADKPVSYTHLDVYKRQALHIKSSRKCPIQPKKKQKMGHGTNEVKIQNWQ